MRDFTEDDARAWAGAESFPDGSEPMIGELKIDGKDSIVIIDRCFIMVYCWIDSKEEFKYGGIECGEITREMKIALAERFFEGKELKSKDLPTLGIKDYD